MIRFKLVRLSSLSLYWNPEDDSRLTSPEQLMKGVKRGQDKESDVEYHWVIDINA